MDQQRFYDLSRGQALRPFSSALQWATKVCLTDIHSYDDDGSYTREALHNLGNFLFRTLSIKPPDWSGVATTRIMPTVGITGGFKVTLEALAERVKDFANDREKELQPTLIMPTPTYGMFERTAKRLGYNVVSIDRDRNQNWHLDPNLLYETLIKIEANTNLHPTAFFDSNPHNPTGVVRGEHETRELASVISTFNDNYAKRNARSTYWWGDVPRLNIIDDMAYLGTEYDAKKPFSYAAIPDVHHNTFLMLGLSKIGLAGLRAGLVVIPEPDGSTQYVDIIRRLEHDNKYFMSSVALQAIKYCFSNNERHVTSRQRFLKQLSRDHAFNGKLMKALVNGIDDCDVSNGQREKMINLVAESKNISHESAKAILTQGITGARIITTPEAGFFHLIDFSALRGKSYKNDIHPTRLYLAGTTEATDEYAIEHVFSSVGLKFCSGTFTGLNSEEMTVRVSYAFEPNDIIEICHRLDLGCKAFQPTTNNRPSTSTHHNKGKKRHSQPT